MRPKFTWTGDNRIVTINISRILTLQETRPTGAAWKSATTRTFSGVSTTTNKTSARERRHGKNAQCAELF
jgi:hypothetical protein